MSQLLRFITTEERNTCNAQRCTVSKGGQTAILVRWRTSGLEKIADQRQRTTEIELPLVHC
jgi:hypothetical protein